MFRVRKPRPEVEPAPPADPAFYYALLERVGSILDGLPWLVAGGLAIPLTLGRFYRTHADLDIVFPLHRIGDVDDAMRRAGYRLTTRIIFDLPGRRVEARLPIRGRGIVIRFRQRKLRFVPRWGHPSPLPLRLDVLPYVEGNGWIEACNSRRRVACTTPLEGRRIRLPSGRDVGCLDLHYARALMRRPHCPVHRLDRAVMDGAAYGSLVTDGPPASSWNVSQTA